MIELYYHQRMAVQQMHNGCILCGGVGSGKSRTSLAYYYTKECGGSLKVNGEGEDAPMVAPKDLYIITTARKRDTMEWDDECVPFDIHPKSIDSWNNIGKYTEVKDAFFIFDEQRVVGNGAWVKAFLKITKANHWVLLSATPGDTWTDYIPVFIANGYYKNRTEFTRRHVVYSRWTKYPKVDHYVNCGRLIKLRQQTLVNMRYVKPTESHDETIFTSYDIQKYKTIMRMRWNPYTNEPIENISGLCSILRRVCNSDQSRVLAVQELILENPKCIIFYNFDYELDILRELCSDLKIEYAEWNGHKHEPLPQGSEWVYLVQYSAGAEGWNCITTNVIIFYSQSYSYKTMIQAAGRIDRLNTPYSDLYFYHVRSKAPIDIGIYKCLSKKKDFNERKFFEVS